jgi:predicted CoA-binding protein
MEQVDFRELYGNVNTWAVVGYSDNPERAGHYVPQYLRQQGYRIIAVNPKFGSEVDGLPNYPSLADIPAEEQVDVVDIFRAPQYLPEVLADALRMEHQPRYFWMQPGAENPEVADAARQQGLTPIMGACALAMHRKLFAHGQV